MNVPHRIPGWAKIGVVPVDQLNEDEQKRLVNIGDSVSRQTENKYILFKKTGAVTASNERPLTMMYHRRKSVNSKSLRIDEK